MLQPKAATATPALGDSDLPQKNENSEKVYNIFLTSFTSPTPSPLDTQPSPRSSSQVRPTRQSPATPQSHDAQQMSARSSPTSVLSRTETV